MKKKNPTHIVKYERGMDHPYFFILQQNACTILSPVSPEFIFPILTKIPFSVPFIAPSLSI
jgi:hypothetical protein